MGTLLQDLRYGLRVLTKKPGFTAVAVLTLALGIGANTAIFSVVNAVLLRPLPYPEPERLMTFWLSSPADGPRRVQWTEGLFAFYHDRSRSFEKLAAYSAGSGVNLTGRGEPSRLNGTTVTSDFFRVLGQEPIYGRAFLPQEDTPGNNRVAILSYGLWQRHFGGDPKIVGQTLDLNDVPTVVVGVMPQGFDFPNQTELWMPVGVNPQNFDLYYLDPIGRLKPGAAAAEAEREAAMLWGEMARELHWPQGDSATVLTVKPLTELIVGHVRTPLLVLLGAAGLVLLISCANLSNLLLARAVARSREMAVRCCLGASSWRIVRQLLTESVLLALAGAAGGIFVAAWGVEGLKRLLPVEVARIEQLDLSAAPLPRIEQVQIDLKVLLVTFGLALLTGVLLGMAPAWRAARVNLREAMKDGGRGSASGSSRRLSSAFVVAQVALSLVLLVGAALLLESFRNLLAVDPGFRAQNVWAGRLELPADKYADEAQARRFYRRLVERVAGLPGVQSAGLCQRLPFFGGGDGNVFTVEGREPAPSEPLPNAWYRDVDAGYFSAMGIRIVTGRPFQDADTETSTQVAIVDEKLARAYWPGEDPAGKRLRFGRANWGTPLMTVVGVAAGVKHRQLDEKSGFYIYRPVSQEIQPSMYLVVRTAVRSEALAPAVRREVGALDAGLPLFEVTTMEEAVSRSLATRRLTNLLLVGFAVTALLLAAVGIYGVISLDLNSRIREFGIRTALGAQPGDALRLVIGQGVKLAAVGVVIGVMAALALTRLMRSLLFGVSATDPLTYAALTVFLLLVAFLACLVPARRAAKVDPMVALRYE